MNSFSLHTWHSMQGAINHWWDGWQWFVELEIDPVTDEEKIPKDSIPFWVSQLLDQLRDSVGAEFDLMSGRWNDAI